jgi:N6-L-threonylcarbamoyladenine synthase
VLDAAVEKARIEIEKVDLVAYTRGPGLLGALLVGSTFAKAFALATRKPTIGVSHIEAHIYSLYPEIDYPILILIVSGGHTELVVVRAEFEYEHIGTTIDDACGEAFDKVARVLGLNYPGGPEIERLSKDGNPDLVPLPRPKTGGFDFSFSGLKTAVLYYYQDHPDANPADIAASFQRVVCDYLIEKTLAAARVNRIDRLGVCGGVSANKMLKERFFNLTGYKTIFPAPEFTTDNGVMVAYCGMRRFNRFGPSPLNLPVFPTKKGLL